MAIVLGQRVIAEPAFIENPTPSIFSPAELEYDTRNSGALRPGETAIGMDKPASPESIAENDTGMAPETISLTASGDAARTAAFDALQTRIDCAGNLGFSSLHVHAGRMAQTRMTTAKSHTRPNHRIHKAIETFPAMKNARDRLARAKAIINARPHL